MKRIISLLVASVMLMAQTLAQVPVEFQRGGFHVYRLPQDPGAPTKHYLTARDQSPNGFVWTPRKGDKVSQEFYDQVRKSVVRLYISKIRTLGTGTIIATRPEEDGRVLGVILTCAHIFNCGDKACAQEQSPIADFPAMRSRAKVLAIDWKNEKSERTELDLSDIRSSLRSVMWRNVGLFRLAERLTETLDIIAFWGRYVLDKEFYGTAGWEAQNMLTASYVISNCALLRTETRGVHCREDFPDIDPAWARHQTARRTPDKLVIE